jgi:hypothetical protein
MSYRSGATLSISSIVRTPAMPLPTITSFDFFIAFLQNSNVLRTSKQVL